MSADDVERPVVLNPESIGNPDITPIMQVPRSLAAWMKNPARGGCTDCDGVNWHHEDACPRKLDLIPRAQHEITEDRRIAAMCKQQHGRDALNQRANVTAELVAAIQLREYQRSQLVSEVEKLRGALETIRDKAYVGLREAIVNRPKMERALFDILAVIERAGIEP